MEEGAPDGVEGSRDETREKLSQVYRYLQALDQRRNVPVRQISRYEWTLPLSELPKHPAIQLPPPHAETSSESAATPSPDGSGAEEWLLRVGRPELQDAPPPPPLVREWLRPGWENPDRSISVLETKDRREGSYRDPNERPVRFADDPDRVQQLEEWRPHWTEWAESERPARAAMRVFQRLYSLRAELDRRSELVELMAGDGLLDWPMDDGAIRHPVLLQRLELRFDPDTPEFTLVDAERPPELHLALLRAIPGVPISGLNTLREELDRSAWHPLGGAETDAFLGRVAVRLSPLGRFVESSTLEAGPPRGREDAPVLSRDPVVFVRARTLGFATFIDAILQDLPTRDDLPEAIQRVIGDERPEAIPVASQAPAQAWGSDGWDERVLLCKPANSEQLQVAQRLEGHGAVLVQGPPGTGKTHTIANLVGHLLSEGKSVLITSHTAKALQVVRQHLPEQIRPLCVSVLNESRREMEGAVEGITEKLGNSDAAALGLQATALSSERQKLLASIHSLQGQLRDARADEYRPVILAGEEIPPSDAARQVREGLGQHDWIPRPVEAGSPLPLSISELAELYATNARVSAEQEDALDAGLPAPDDLLRPDEFDSLAADYHRLVASDLVVGQDLWRTSDQDPLHLLGLLDQLAEALRPLTDPTPWLLKAVHAGYAGGGFREPWEDLLAAIDIAYTRLSASQALLVGKEVGPLEGADPKTAQTVDEMLDHLAKGGRLGRAQLLLRRRWRRLLDQVRVNDAPPMAKEELETVAAWLALRAARKDLLRRWKALVSDSGGPAPAELGQEPERGCRQLAPSIRLALDWYVQAWSPLAALLEEAGLDCAAALDRTPVSLEANSELLRLRRASAELMAPALEGQVRRLRRTEVLAALRALELRVAPRTSQAVSPLVSQLREAVDRVDAAGYRAAFDSLHDLLLRSAALRRRRELLERLLPSSPGWAALIRERQGVHSGSELPGDPSAAWRWRQLDDELQRRGSTSMEGLQGRLRQSKDRLQEVTLQLVDRRAWAAQVHRTTLSQRQALMGWKQLMVRVGKGTGKRVAEFKVEARKLMPRCQSAVPVWVMPIARVVENFDPRTNRFDVVIIDEASQADLMALCVLYMAKQVVVVGDPEQVSPLAISEQTDMVRGLIDTYLEGIPNRALYDGRTSMYALAQTSFSGTVMLREHFRSVRPIAEFSNQLSYNGRLVPLRDASNVDRRPHTVAHRVRSLPTTGRRNDTEAREVAALLRACLALPEYEGATFGVISMVGEEQAQLIDRWLRDWVSPVEYERRRIRCGTSAQFQGDERDVMFLSMVDANNREGPMTLRADGAGDMFKKRFNVAASRARDQMWVVYSMNPETDLKPDDLRRRLILHAQDPTRLVKDLAVAAARTDSEFERRVLESLLRQGYRVIPQWPVGSYRIDMVVEGDGKRLAIECDGDRWHTEENLQADMERQAILERLGWTFLRLRGTAFFRNPEAAMEGVFTRLAGMGIPPEGAREQPQPSSAQSEELRVRVVRRAAELRREMGGGTADEDPVGDDPALPPQRSFLSPLAAEAPAAESPDPRLALRQPANVTDADESSAPTGRRVRVCGQVGTLLSETQDEKGAHWLVLLDGETKPKRFLVRRK